MGDQVGVRDRPIHSGGEAAPSRSRPAPRRTSIHSGKDHSVADIASFLSVGEHLTQRKFLSVHEYSNVLRRAERLGGCLAAQPGRRGKTTPHQPPTILSEGHTPPQFYSPPAPPLNPLHP